VIGGLYRLEGAWVGAIFFALLDNYSREHTPDIGEVLGPERFNTLIGIIFLVIVLVSPGGLVGLWDKAKERMGPSSGGRRSRAGPAGGDQPPPPVKEPLGPRRAA
jgi:branched-chain amino acid transport system permease protein